MFSSYVYQAIQQLAPTDAQHKKMMEQNLLALLIDSNFAGHYRAMWA